MNPEELEKIEQLKDEVHDLLCNRLTYPKVFLQMLEAGELPKGRFSHFQNSIDESIQLVDIKFAELLRQFSNEP